MALLNTSTPDVCGPEDQLEEEPYLYGFVWSVTRRTNTIVRVTWAINAAGGDAAPATHALGGVTYNLLTTSIDRGYGKPNGHFTAIYRKEGTWTPVIP